MGPHIAMSAAVWAVTGFFIGAVIATLAGMIGAWKWFSFFFATAGVAVAMVGQLRGKVGVAVGALGGSLFGYFIASMIQNYSWQIGAILIIAGALVGTFLGLNLQSRFTRNTRRSPAGGVSDFYERHSN